MDHENGPTKIFLVSDAIIVRGVPQYMQSVAWLAGYGELRGPVGGPGHASRPISGLVSAARLRGDRGLAASPRLSLFVPGKLVWLVGSFPWNWDLRGS